MWMRVCVCGGGYLWLSLDTLVWYRILSSLKASCCFSQGCFKPSVPLSFFSFFLPLSPPLSLVVSLSSSRHMHKHTNAPINTLTSLSLTVNSLYKTYLWRDLLYTHAHTHTHTRIRSQPNAITHPIQDTPYLLNCTHKHKEDAHTCTHWHKISTFTVSPVHTEHLYTSKWGSLSLKQAIILVTALERG